MNDHSKILVSLLLGIAAGVALGLLFSMDDEADSPASLQPDTAGVKEPAGIKSPENDWSDVNDSLGG